jgi:hypothetical protein
MRLSEAAEARKIARWLTETAKRMRDADELGDVLGEIGGTS